MTYSNGQSSHCIFKIQGCIDNIINHNRSCTAGDFVKHLGLPYFWEMCHQLIMHILVLQCNLEDVYNSKLESDWLVKIMRL